ncbi:hypothetical protein [Cellvibrio mixtus]|nr:hypothetical protein [Cellvibrio mixtus]
MDKGNKVEKKDLWEITGVRIGGISGAILLVGVIVSYSYSYGKDAGERVL